MEARTVVPTIFVVACLTGSAVAAEDDPSLSLLLDFEDLTHRGELDALREPGAAVVGNPGDSVWTTTDVSRQSGDVYRFAGGPGQLSRVRHGEGHALRSSSPEVASRSDRHPWADKRVPDKAMSVLMWTRLEGWVGHVTFKVWPSSQDFELSAGAGTGQIDGLELVYDWSLYHFAGAGGGPTRSSFSLLARRPQTDSWMFSAATYDRVAGQAKLYVNGALEAVATCDEPIPQDWGDPDDLVAVEGVHLRFHGRGVRGEDVSVWTRALTHGEIVRMAREGGLSVSSVGNVATSWGALKSR